MLIDNTPVRFIIVTGATGASLYGFGFEEIPSIKHGSLTGLQDKSIKLFGHPVPTPSKA